MVDDSFLIPRKLAALTFLVLALGGGEDKGEGGIKSIFDTSQACGMVLHVSSTAG